MKLLNVAKKYGNKVIAATALTTASALAAADGVDLSGIGTTAAAEIAKFAVMVSRCCRSFGYRVDARLPHGLQHG